MTFKAKFVGGKSDGITVETHLKQLPDLVHGKEPGSYFYLSDSWYLLTGIDYDNKIGYYEPTSLQNFPDGIMTVENGEIIIEKNAISAGSPEDGLKDEGK